MTRNQLQSTKENWVVNLQRFCLWIQVEIRQKVYPAWKTFTLARCSTSREDKYTMSKLLEPVILPRKPWQVFHLLDTFFQRLYRDLDIWFSYSILFSKDDTFHLGNTKHWFQVNVLGTTNLYEASIVKISKADTHMDQLDITPIKSSSQTIYSKKLSDIVVIAKSVGIKGVTIYLDVFSTLFEELKQNWVDYGCLLTIPGMNVHRLCGQCLPGQHVDVLVDDLDNTEPGCLYKHCLKMSYLGYVISGASRQPVFSLMSEIDFCSTFLSSSHTC